MENINWIEFPEDLDYGDCIIHSEFEERDYE